MEREDPFFEGACCAIIVQQLTNLKTCKPKHIYLALKFHLKLFLIPCHTIRAPSASSLSFPSLLSLSQLHPAPNRLLPPPHSPNHDHTDDNNIFYTAASSFSLAQGKMVAHLKEMMVWCNYDVVRR